MTDYSHGSSTRGRPRAVRLPGMLMVLGALVSAIACGSSSASSGDIGALLPGGGTTAAGGTGAGGSGTVPAVEQEREDSFLVPAVSGTRIFSVNPGSGRVAVIDTTSLEIQLTNAGFAPTQVVALPRAGGLDRALVLNSGSNDASYLAVAADGVITSRRIATHEGANRVSVSADGQWALVWTDYRKVPQVDPTDGFQDITVVRLATGEPTRLTVGFRPVVVALNGDRSVGYVSAEPGIDVIDLQGDRPVITHSIAFSGAATPAVASQDVTFTADTRFAFIRYQDKAELSVLGLQNEEWTSMAMDGIVTDLDLSEDGSMAVAVVAGPLAPTTQNLLTTQLPLNDGGVVTANALFDAGGDGAALDAAVATPDAGAGMDGGGSRDAGVDAGRRSADAGTVQPQATGSEVAIFRLDDRPTLRDPQLIRVSGEAFGSVSLAADGSVMALFTNAQQSDRITLLSPDDGAHRTVSVKSPVLAVVITPDAEHAIAIQAPAANDMGVSHKKGAFSLIPLKVDRAPKIVATDAPVVSLAMMPGSPSAAGLVTVSDLPTAQFSSYWVSLPALTADAIRLASEPLATGVVGATSLGFVAQQHPEGRLTLVNLKTGAPRTLTGFELAAKVVE